MNRKITIINGSYRENGIIDQCVEAVASAVLKLGGEVYIVNLREKNIEFCSNCRECVQEYGKERGECVLKDDMGDILNKLEFADGIVLAAPVNCYNLNALTRKFYERLLGYFYWPWGKAAPKIRLRSRGKKALLITSAAMPAIMGMFLTGAMKALKGMSEGLGAKPVGKFFKGLASMKEKPVLSENDKAKLTELAKRLIR